MGLADKLGEINPIFPGLPCGISKILNSLGNEEDKTALQTIMETRSYPIGVSNRQIHDALLSEGYDIAFASIRLHRSKQCRCYIGKDSVKRQEVRKLLSESKSTVSRKAASKGRPKKSKAGL